MEPQWTETKARVLLPSVQVEINSNLMEGKLTGFTSQLATVTVQYELPDRSINLTLRRTWEEVCKSLNTHTPLQT